MVGLEQCSMARATRPPLWRVRGGNEKGGLGGVRITVAGLGLLGRLVRDDTAKADLEVGAGAEGFAIASEDNSADPVVEVDQPVDLLELGEQAVGDGIVLFGAVESYDEDFGRGGRVGRDVADLDAFEEEGGVGSWGGGGRHGVGALDGWFWLEWMMVMELMAQRSC